MLENFTVETFAPLLGDMFVVHVDSTNQLELELSQVEPMGSPDASAARHARLPFSLTFRGPPTPVMVQRIYALEHRTLGSFDVFLVPIGPDERGMLYEVVFS